MAALRTLEGFLTANRARARANGAAHVAANGQNGHVDHGGNGHVNGNGNGNGHHPDVWDELRREIARSRRYGRSFAVVRIGQVATRSLAGTLRAIDREWVAEGATYLLLPEAVRGTAESLVGRLRIEAPDAVSGCSVTVAAFPEDGLTSGALLKALRTADAAARDSVHHPALRVGELPAVHA